MKNDIVLPAFSILILFGLITMSTPVKAHNHDSKTALLPPCPDSPNCVSSLDERPGKHIAPFPLTGSISESLSEIEKIILSMPRTGIVIRTGRTLHAEFRTRLGFVDDVMFAAGEEGKVIHVRSSSRTGSWDLGVNRRRVEKIRKLYEQVND